MNHGVNDIRVPYILRFDEGRAQWELTMFQSPGGQPQPSLCHVR
jgi:hypothetical protein